MSGQSTTLRTLLDSTKRGKDAGNNKSSSLKEDLAAIGHTSPSFCCYSLA